MDAIQHYHRQFKRATDTLPGAAHLSWLRERRHAAMEAFLACGFPTRKQEDWKYTSVVSMSDHPFALSDGTHTVSTDTLAPFLASPPNALRLVFVNGCFRADLSALSPPPGECLVCPLSEALARYPEKLAPHLGTGSSEPILHGFHALNTAFIREGFFVLVPTHVVLDAPIHAIFVGSQADSFNNLRNLVVLEDGAQATIVERFVGERDPQYFSNTVTEVIAGPHAKIQHYKVQQEGSQGVHIGTLLCRQYASSDVQSYSFSFGGQLVRSDTYTHFAEAQASCALWGLYTGKDRQHIDHHTTVDHAHARGCSREYYKGILDDKAHAVFNGKILVAPNAQQTDAQQTNKNLLLSRRAEVDTKPQLEIYADDVKCTHGATVGQLDKNALFYLRSRGIPEKEARALLIHAFAFEIIAQVTVPTLRDALEQSLLGALR